MRPSRPDRPAAYVLGLSPSGLAVARTLGREGVRVHGFDGVNFAGALRAPGFSSRYCASADPCPDPVARGPELLETLRARARAESQKPVLFLTEDPYIEFVARHRDALAESFRFVYPPREITEALLDKRKQVELALRHGICCPKTFFPESRADVLAIRGELDYPVFIKPLHGHLWREKYRDRHMKGFRVESATELLARFDEVLDGGFRAMVQSIVLGPPTNVLRFFAYVSQDGELLAVHTARRLRQYPTDFGNTAMAETLPLPELVDVATAFLRAIGHRGNAGIEMKLDTRDGRMKFIELNARPELIQAMPIAAGIETPLVEYLDAIGERPPPLRRQRDGVRWAFLANDARAFLATRAAGELSVGEWLSSWLRVRAFAVHAWDDPMPGLQWYGAGLARELRTRVRARLGRGCAPR